MTGEDLKGERIRPVKILTGGSPRLLRIISTFAAGMSIKELMDDLVRLVDEHTEYFKSHLDALAPIERKVYLGLAELWTQSTAREVGRVARLEVSKTSSFLGRLKEKGMVIEISGKGKKKLYQVAERMYNIYYLMRRRGTPAARVKAVVHFMVSFYQPEELVQVARLIGKEACELGVEMCKDHLLFYEGILTNSVTKPYRERLLEAVPDKFREKVGISIPGEELEEKEGKQVADEVRKLIKEANELSEQKDKLEEAVKLYRKVVEMEPELVSAWHGLGLAMGDLGRYEEAESAFRKAVELKEDDA
jgi:tetratricopeptide (TPR) repeat protein